MPLQPGEIQALQAAARAGNEAAYWEVKNHIMSPLREQVARAIAGNQSVDQIRRLKGEIARLEDEIARAVPESIRVDGTMLVNAIKNAIITRNTNEVTQLIDAGANVHAQNGEGNLPLFAALNIHEDNRQMSVMICETLTNRGANWDQKPNLDLISRDENNPDRRRAKKISPRVLASAINSEDLLSVMRNRGIQPASLPLSPPDISPPQGQQRQNPPQYQPLQAQPPQYQPLQAQPQQYQQPQAQVQDPFAWLRPAIANIQSENILTDQNIVEGMEYLKKTYPDERYQEYQQSVSFYTLLLNEQNRRRSLQELMTAIQYGNLQKIGELLSNNPGLVNQTYKSITPLICAYQYNQLGSAIELLQRGADILSPIQDQYGRTASQARQYSLLNYIGGPGREPLREQERMYWREAELVTSWKRDYQHYMQNPYDPNIMSDQMLSAVIRHLNQQGPYYQGAENDKNILFQIQQQRQYAALQARQYQQGVGPSQPSGPSQPLGGNPPPLSAEQIRRREEVAKLEAEVEQLRKQKEEFERRQQPARRGVAQEKKEEKRAPAVIGKRAENVERVFVEPLLNPKQLQYVRDNVQQIAWLVRDHVKAYPGLDVACDAIRIRLEGDSAKPAAQDLKDVLAILIQSKMEEDAKKQKRQGPR